MAYMSRGGSPSVNNSSSNLNDMQSNTFNYYSHYHHIYYRIDSVYYIMEILTTLLFIGVIALTYIFAYKSPIIDLTENIKVIYINSYLIILSILVAVTLIISFFSESKESLLKKFEVICIISLLILILFGGIRLILDSIYNKEKFEQIYIEQSNMVSNNENTIFYVGVDGIGLKNEKELYISEYIKLYSLFKIKTYGLLIIHLLLNILIIYIIIKIKEKQDNMEKLKKDDIVVYDEEKNVL